MDLPIHPLTIVQFCVLGSFEEETDLPKGLASWNKPREGEETPEKESKAS